VNALPKVELHLHLDCCASYACVRALRPQVTLAEYRRDFVAPPRCVSLTEFLARVPRIVELMQDRRGLELMVDDVFDQLGRDGVVYAELRFAPLQHLDGGLSADEVVAVVERATARAIAATGIQARLILCTLRHFGAGESMETAELAVAHRDGLVAGLDVAGDEAGFGLDAHEPAFAHAARAGLSLTAHAGEAAGPDSVRETLARLAPSRIGHGVRSVEDPALVARLARERIHLEICPSSNVQTMGARCASYGEHPVDRLRRAGVPLSISTDARTVTDVTLMQEHERLRATFDWSDADLRAVQVEAMRASFAPQEVKAALLARLGG